MFCDLGGHAFLERQAIRKRLACFVRHTAELDEVGPQLGRLPISRVSGVADYRTSAAAGHLHSWYDCGQASARVTVLRLQRPEDHHVVGRRHGDLRDGPPATAVGMIVAGHLDDLRWTVAGRHTVKSTLGAGFQSASDARDMESSAGFRRWSPLFGQRSAALPGSWTMPRRRPSRDIEPNLTQHNQEPPATRAGRLAGPLRYGATIAAATAAMQNPWFAAAIAVLIASVVYGVIMPAIWSRQEERRRVARAILRDLLRWMQRRL